MLKKVMLAAVIASLPIGMMIGFFVVEFIWQPALGAKERFFVIFLIGGAVLLLTITPILLFDLMATRKRLARGREALAAGDVETAYREVHPLLNWLTCNKLDEGEEAIALMAEVYRSCEMETPIEEIADLHRRHCEMYEEHKDYQGLIHDEAISDELDAMFERCRALAKQLPAPVCRRAT